MNPQEESPAEEHSDGAGLRGGCCRWLIQRAAHTSPAELAARLEEEWLADLAAQQGPMARLRFALGCCWATRVIAHDFLGSRAAAASSVTAQGSLLIGQHDLAFFSRRTTVLLLIVGLHVIVIWGFVTGFAQKVMGALPNPMTTEIDYVAREPHAAPPIIASHLTPLDVRVPKIDLSVVIPPDSITTNLVSQVPPHSPPVTPPAQPLAVKRTLGGPGQGFPNTDDYYPLDARRLGEVGAAAVRVCVDGKGRLASAPTLAQSSGIGQLDAAALRLAAAGSGHYRSSTADGVPVADCFAFRIRFRLQE